MTVADQSGRVVVVTGGNSGIGLETAAVLAAAGATTVITARNPEKGEAAVTQLRQRSGRSDVHLVHMDLASLASVRAAAAEILERWDRLDILVNNAGGMLTDAQTTAEGLEATVGGNHAGHFELTRLLLDRLRASAPARVVTVSSIAHRGASSVTEADFFLPGSYNGMAAYSRSKLANLLFARELARREREAGSGIASFAVHPGGVRSGFGMEGDIGGVLGFGWRLIRPLMVSPATGAGPSVYTAVAPGLEAKSGSYFQRAVGGNYGPVVDTRPSAAGRNDEAARELWAVTEKVLAALR